MKEEAWPSGLRRRTANALRRMCSRKFESYCFRMEKTFASENEEPEKRKKYDEFLPSGGYTETEPIELYLKNLKSTRKFVAKLRRDGREN